MSANSIAWVVGVAVIVVLAVLWFLNSRKGTINILLDTRNFHDGETVTGKIVLTVKKPLAKTGPLKVEINCDEEHTERDAKGMVHRSSKRIAHQEVVLDNQTSMPVGEKTYDFQITLPSMVNSPRMMKDSFMGFADNKNLRWTLLASLEIPGLNISNSENITVF